MVNSIKNDSPDTILPLEEYQAKQKASGIMRFYRPAQKRKEKETSIEEPTKKPKLSEPAREVK